MTRYIFSQGTIRVEEGIDLAKEKRNHPLGTTVLLIVKRPAEYNTDKSIANGQEKVNADDRASRFSVK
jgi:hypothetical protein